jgi:predicted O-methyltransferase YrrM
MRPEALKNGLLSMIQYINKNTPTNSMRMAEIGSYAGESTEIFAQHFNHIIAIDPFLDDYDPNDVTCSFMSLPKVYDTFKATIDKYSNITHIRRTSDKACKQIQDNSLDFVYIDGLHTYDQVKKDIKNYYSKIKDGGFIGGHDYAPAWQGVMDAINENFKVEQTFSDTSWIVRIKK